uniref:Chitin-binding type-2 domain-containing protein n=1 Tax=Timema poppense TaxID=170557 RepID=A0A7R9DEV8_TIMPO|nr:unnamed protein product [Timema poppensis]
MGIYNTATGLVLLMGLCRGDPPLYSDIRVGSLSRGVLEDPLLKDVSVSCTHNGYSCSPDCQTVQLCANGVLFNVTRCKDETFCNAGSPVCTDDDTSCTSPDGFPFFCCNIGLFPDLYNCSNYYLCDSDVGGATPIRSFTCPAGSVFDIGTLSCSGTGACSGSRAPDCSANPTGALRDNPSLYYVCGLYPGTSTEYAQVCRCPYGVYNVTTFSCETVGGPTTSSSGTTSGPFQCHSQGIFSDPESCSSFIACPIDLVPQHVSCPDGSYFDGQSMTCILGTCSERRGSPVLVKFRRRGSPVLVKFRRRGSPVLVKFRRRGSLVLAKLRRRGSPVLVKFRRRGSPVLVKFRRRGSLVPFNHTPCGVRTYSSTTNVPMGSSAPQERVTSYIPDNLPPPSGRLLKAAQRDQVTISQSVSNRDEFSSLPMVISTVKHLGEHRLFHACAMYSFLYPSLPSLEFPSISLRDHVTTFEDYRWRDRGGHKMSCDYSYQPSRPYLDKPVTTTGTWICRHSLESGQLEIVLNSRQPWTHRRLYRTQRFFCGLLDAMRSDPMEHLILEDSVSTCNDTGYSCTSDCKTVQLCTAERLFNLTHCPGYTFCDADNHACADDQMSCPNWRPPAFTCCDHGLFPDLYDCSRYYLCYKDQFGSKPEVYECEEGTAFDVETLSCTQKGGCARSRAPVCSLETPTGALKDNPSIYYVCTLVDGVMYPQLCRCDQGYYDPMTTSCVTTPGEVGTTTSSGPDEFRCSEQGIFGDPESCEAYYVCSLSLQATHGFCVNGTHFNQTRHSCVLGTC